jgi:hypothetical protein
VGVEPEWRSVPDIDAAAYHASLGPVAERIRASETPGQALQLAESFLDSSASRFGADVREPFCDEVAYLWSVFPERLRDLSRYKLMLNVLLAQVVDAAWYGAYPRYASDADVDRDDTLVTFARSKEDFDVRFDYVQYYGHILMRIPNSMRLRYRRATNHPGRYTQGLTTTRCKRAAAALANEIAEAVRHDARSGRARSIMVNSMLRTVPDQHSLATWGYVAPRRSAHLAGYAIDIEKAWYERHEQRVSQSLERVILDLARRDIIYAVDEQTHWHICLDPAQIPTFESQFSRWAR